MVYIELKSTCKGKAPRADFNIHHASRLHMLIILATKITQMQLLTEYY